jgi:hypothetical protein
LSIRRSSIPEFACDVADTGRVLRDCPEEREGNHIPVYPGRMGWNSVIP